MNPRVNPHKPRCRLPQRRWSPRELHPHAFRRQLLKLVRLLVPPEDRAMGAMGVEPQQPMGALGLEPRHFSLRGRYAATRVPHPFTQPPPNVIQFPCRLSAMTVGTPNHALLNLSLNFSPSKSSGNKVRHPRDLDPSNMVQIKNQRVRFSTSHTRMAPKKLDQPCGVFFHSNLCGPLDLSPHLS